ncbi:MAG TPA: glycosyltransferase family 2 protein [Terrimesophilobacter sp.]|nr:glycosyltransferase family 2 protein [Terrimesophilobacter sp.]
MQPRVTAIVVARNGGAHLKRTLAALAAQSRSPDVTIAVDVSSTDDSEALLSEFGSTHLLSVRDGTTFGGAIAHASHYAPVAESANEWLWLLGHDNAPSPDALQKLLGAVEVAPSVSVAGPKLTSVDNPKWIAEFGHTITRFGRTVSLVTGELDQAQHDTRDDVLAVSAAGMLVRRSVWEKLGGFDPGLPSIDASLDFSVRARLAGNRVVLVPAAKVSSAGGPQDFGRKPSSAARTFRIARAAQLHRRLVYSPTWALVLHWLSLVPLAVARSIGDLIGKRPGAIGGEIGAAFGAAFSGRVGAARRNLRKNRVLGWGAIAPLRMTAAEARELRAQAREAELADFDLAHGGRTLRAPRAGFIAHAGLWVVLLVGVVGVLAYGALLGANAITGGGLRPLSGTAGALWSHIGIGWREVGTGLFGAADPFAAVLALLGSLTFWNPSLSIVLLYLAAIPLAALAAWSAARSMSRNPWLPALAAILWAFSPPLLSSLAGGHLGAVIAHLLLPWLFLAALGAARSWASGAAAALLFAGVAAGAPSLVPGLLLLFVVLLIARPTRIHRTVGIPIPAFVLFAPLIVHQILAGNPLALFADPGVPVVEPAASGWQLALGDASGTLNGWTAALAGLHVPGIAAPILVVALVAPLAVLALLSLFLPGARRAVPSLLVALLGFATAALAHTLQVGAVGVEPVTVWTGPGLSLFWLGLIAAALGALDALGRIAVPMSVLAGLGASALAIPLLGAMVIGTAQVQPSEGRIMPALVTAEAGSSPNVGTIVLTSLGKAGVSATLERGRGATLDEQSTLVSTKPRPDDHDVRLATLAGNLATRSGFDFVGEFSSLGVSFVLVPPGHDSDPTYRTTLEALGGNETLNPVGSTTTGLLWRFTGTLDTPPVHPGNADTFIGHWYLVALGVVFGVTVLLAIPIGGRGRRRRPSAEASDELADTFDEDEHD